MRRRNQSLIEYAVLIGLLALAMFVGINKFRSTLGDAYDTAQKKQVKVKADMDGGGGGRMKPSISDPEELGRHKEHGSHSWDYDSSSDTTYCRECGEEG